VCVCVCVYIYIYIYIYIYDISSLRVNIILPSACRYSKRSLSFKFSPKTLYAIFFTTMRAIARPSYRIWRGVRVMNLFICCFASLLLLPPPHARLSSSAPYSRTPSACVLKAVLRPHPRRAKL